MNFDKLFALMAYAFQAIATLALVFGVGRLLPANDYGHFSLIVASSQSISIFAFEWIRLAATRFCADVTHDDAKLRKHTVLAAFYGAGLILTVLAALSVSFGVFTIEEASLVLAVALLVGATDLQLVFLRVQGSFASFSKLQSARATILVAMSCLFAWHFGTALFALLGLVVGYGLSLLLFISASPSWWRLEFTQIRWPVLIELGRYGLSAAAASVTAMQVPLLLRWTAKSFLPVESFGGFSLAMDLLQKPFAMVSSAIGGVLTPGVIIEFEQCASGQRPRLKQLYELQFWSTMLLLGSGIALLPEVALILVKPAFRESLLSTGAYVALIFALHTLIHSTISIPGHLLKAGTRLIANAVVELILVGVAVLPCLFFGLFQPYSWLIGVVLAVLLSCIYALPLVKRVPCIFPWTTFAVSPFVAIALAINFLFMDGASIIHLIEKALVLTMI